MIVKIFIILMIIVNVLLFGENYALQSQKLSDTDSSFFVALKNVNAPIMSCKNIKNNCGDDGRDDCFNWDNDNGNGMTIREMLKYCGAVSLESFKNQSVTHCVDENEGVLNEDGSYNVTHYRWRLKVNSCPKYKRRILRKFNECVAKLKVWTNCFMSYLTELCKNDSVYGGSK